MRLSVDHKATDKAEQKRVKKAKGVIFGGRLYGSIAVTRALGDFNLKNSCNGLINEPSISKTVIDDSDLFLVMASDGIWDVVKDEMAYKFIIDNKITEAEDLVKFFVKKAMELGSHDNISCIAIKLS